MNRVLRIKAVSNAIGIRRSVVGYKEINVGKYELDDFEYPLKGLKYELEIENNVVTLIFDNKRVILKDGQAESFSKTRNVKTLNGETTEYITYDFMLVPLSLDAIDYYQDSIKNGYIFDEKSGEFSYLIGLIYKSEGMNDLSQKYFEQAKNEGFR